MKMVVLQNTVMRATVTRTIVFSEFGEIVYHPYESAKPLRLDVLAHSMAVKQIGRVSQEADIASKQQPQ